MVILFFSVSTTLSQNKRPNLGVPKTMDSDTLSVDTDDYNLSHKRITKQAG